MSQVRSDARPFDTSQSGESAPSKWDSVDLQLVRAACPVRLPSYMCVEQPVEPCIAAERARQTAAGHNPYPEQRGAKPIIVVHGGVLDTRPDQMIYVMNSRPKGLFLCINNINFEGKSDMKRDGAEIDEKNILTLFRKLGYRIQCLRDLDYENFKKRIEDFSARPELARVSSVIVCIMSHGHGNQAQDTSVITTDNIFVPCEWIVKQFDVEHCPAMENKPKIFLFQLCRGEGSGLCPAPEVPMSPRTKMDGRVGWHHEHKRLGDDVLIAYATIPGNVSLRDEVLGTWFVQAICTVFARYAWGRDITDLHKKVDAELKYRSAVCDDGRRVMQTCELVGRGFKEFYFMPGVY